MSLESATTINQLVITNPQGTDDRSQGDDHIRLIKSTLQNTFPGITGPVTVTQAQLNAVAGGLVFTGMITMWSGTIASIPAGWKLCNGTGTISNGNPVPNLVDRFIIGSATESGGTYNINATGGSTSFSGVSGSTVLTEAQIPSHKHGLNQAAQYSTSDGGNNSQINYLQGYPNPVNKFTATADLANRDYITATGGGTGHTHTIAGTIVPPYFALAFLIKD